jgi:hypothetical protein
VARTTAGTFLGITVSTAPPYGKFSVHDCNDPGQVSALNCIYPQKSVRMTAAWLVSR